MKVMSACTLDCPDGCSLVVDVEEGEIQRISGNPDHPYTSGFTCRKIRRYPERARSPHRITRPLLRAGGKWQTIDWDSALDLCAERIQSFRAQPASILHIHGGADKGVLSRLNRLFFARLGAGTVGGSLCDTAGMEACGLDFGSLDQNDTRDLLNARRIVNWGRDLSRSSVHVGALVRRARRQGARVWTITPGGDGNASYSDRIIAVRPGTDRFLAAAVIRLMIERDLIDAEILNHTRGWEAFRGLVNARPLSDLSERCRVSVSDIEALCGFYNGGEAVASVLAWGLQRYAHGGENVRFINALALLSGNIGRSGGGSYYSISSNRNYNLDAVAAEIDRSPVRALKPTVGRDILNAADPPIKMIWVTGCNIVNQAADSSAIARAFAAVDFKVVVEAFMNDTAERADLVLPCALLLEKEDLVGAAVHNFVNYVAAVADPPGEARPDHWILSELGKRLDPPVTLPGAEEFLQSVLDSPFLDVSLEEVRRRGFVEAQRPAIAYEGMRFDHPDGAFHFPETLHDEPDPAEGYPLRLLSLVRRDAIHSQMLPEEQEVPPAVWVSPNEPALKGLDLDAPVYLASPLGKFEVQVRTSEELPPGVVVYRRGDWMKLGGGVNRLIADDLTDLGDGAAFYNQHVRLENGRS